MTLTRRPRILGAAAILVALPLLQTGSATAASAPTPSCAPGSLVPVAATAFEGTYSFALHNAGATACALPLHPSVTLAAQGRIVPVRYTSEGSEPRLSHVPPGGLATFTLTPKRTGCVTADRVIAQVATTTAVFDGAAVGVCRGTKVSVGQFRVAIPAGH